MSRMYLFITIALCLGLLSCVEEGKGGGESCYSNEECRSNCCITGINDVDFNNPHCAASDPPSNYKCKGEVGSAQGCGDYRDNGLTDTQTKSFCQAAYAYKCQGHQQGVTSSCNTLGGFGGDVRSRCPYCN